MLPKPLQSLTDGTITDLDRLGLALEETRERGWAISAGERVSGASAVSVPVFAHGQLIAAISVLGPSTRLSEERLEDVAAELRAAAEQIEGLLEGSNEKEKR